MRNQLLAPRETAPSLPARTTAAESVLMWIDLMKSVDRLLLAGMIREVGSDQAREAYRQWSADRFARHGAHMERLAGRLRALGD